MTRYIYVKHEPSLCCAAAPHSLLHTPLHIVHPLVSVTQRFGWRLLLIHDPVPPPGKKSCYHVLLASMYNFLSESSH